MSKGNLVIVKVSRWPGKYRRWQFWGRVCPSASYRSGISNPVSLSFTFLPVFASLLQLATCPAFGFPCLLFQVLGMEVLLLIEFMRKSMCVNPGKERLSERLSARRKRKVYWGVMEEGLLLCAASFVLAGLDTFLLCSLAVKQLC